jgi:hypothetical protein
MLAAPDQSQERFSLLVIGNAVKGEQNRYVALPEADPPKLHTADLGVGCLDRPASCSNSDSSRFPEPT